MVRDTILNVHANGETNYSLKDVFVRVIARWDYEAAEGGDTHYALIKGTKADLLIRQGSEEGFKPTLYIIPAAGRDQQEFSSTLQKAISALSKTYPGLNVEPTGSRTKIMIPEALKSTHEQHFAEVMKRFLQFVKEGDMPAWEVPNMIAKYYTTTESIKIATRSDQSPK